MDQEKLILELIQELNLLKKRVQELEHFEVENKKLRKENQGLKNRLSKYENPKNSNNSSTPPSKDENRPFRTSLREPSGLKPGGQPGRKGNTLKMIETPDFTTTIVAEYCNCCGKDISDIPCKYEGKRQVIDIPEIKPKVTEYQIFSRVCTCGHKTTGDFPLEAKASVSYGNNIESLIGYFHARQYIPFKRMTELLNDVFNTPISEGGIHLLLAKLTSKAQPAYELIRKKLQMTTKLSIGTDETGLKVAGKKHWAWTWQNKEATFITITNNRGQISINEAFKDGFKDAVLVHDCWKSHFNTPAKSHQICIVHLLRDLNYLNELYNHKWSKVCKTIFKSALSLEKQMQKVDYFVHNPRRIQVEIRMDKLLNYSLPKNNKELISFQKRLVKYREYLFTFLYFPEVPADNNASERAIRNIKVKQKVSGQFKSPKGAHSFAVLRSFTDTVIKNNQNVVRSLNFIANSDTD